jgi:DNA primase
VQSIEAALRELGIDYKEINGEAMALCPSHEQGHPTWSCNLKTGVHHCFSCGYSGNLASLVRLVLDCSYPEAVVWVNIRVGWARANQWREDMKEMSFSPPKMKVSDADMAFYIDPPVNQLDNKGITLEGAQEFGVRWNPDEETWIFPIRDPYTNELWGWQLKNDRYFRGYPSGVRKSETLFGLSAHEYGSPVILVESPVDAVRFHAAGIRGCVSSYGVHLSTRQLSLILERTEHLVLALDNDNAGISETARLCRDAGQLRINVFAYGESPAKDPGEMENYELKFGTQNRIGRLKWLREHDNLKRELASLPKGASKPLSFERELASRVLYGTRKDGHWHSSSRILT